MAKIVTMGEIMLRLSTPDYERIIQSKSFDVHYGGGEANVAVSLSHFGNEVEYVSAIPENPIGEAAIASLNKYGVKTSHLSRKGDRLGIYFLETGSSIRASKVIYDRKYSSIAQARPEDFNFDEIFNNVDWFHFTGITPAISDDAAEVIKEALKSAKSKGITVSADLNFRKKLWSSEKAIRVMTELMQYVDVCIGNEEDAEKVLGFKPENNNVEKGELNLAGYKEIFEKMIDKFGFKYVISSLRQSRSASDNSWSACAMDRENREFYHSSVYNVSPIVDRVGGGDSFAAGVIHLLAQGKNYKDALEFGVAASALKHTIPGDFNHVSISEVESLVKGNVSGRVER